MKQIILDMDGTITDLYNVHSWQSYLRKEDTRPYEIAQPIYDPDVLNVTLQALQLQGYTIDIVTWGAKISSMTYLIQTAYTKRQWLKRYNIPFNNFYCVPHGTPKENYINPKATESIIIDDSQDVLKSFLTTEIAAKAIRKAINAAKTNIVTTLISQLN